MSPPAVRRRRKPFRPNRSGGLWPALQYVKRLSADSIAYNTVAKRASMARRRRESLTRATVCAGVNPKPAFAAKIPCSIADSKAAAGPFPRNVAQDKAERSVLATRSSRQNRHRSLCMARTWRPLRSVRPYTGLAEARHVGSQRRSSTPAPPVLSGSVSRYCLRLSRTGRTSPASRKRTPLISRTRRSLIIRSS